LNAQEPTFPESLVRHIKSEPRKAAALVLLVIVLAVMWAKIFVFGETTPAPAAGAQHQNSAARRTDIFPRETPQASRSLIDWTRKPITGTKRNLFAIKMDYFPVDGSRPIFTGDDGDGFWDQLAKSLAAKADQEKAKGILLENLRVKAGQLDLQSTVMSGTDPQALVNGIMLKEGDTIEGFRIDQIEAKQIVVEREGVKLIVKFKH
jgi:hypothetical protein